MSKPYIKSSMRKPRLEMHPLDPASQVSVKPDKACDPLAIECIDHIELCVQNARQASYFYTRGFGFSAVGYSGPETGNRDCVSIALEQGEARMILTTPLRQNHTLAFRVAVHSDHVMKIAFRVPDCVRFFNTAVARGAVATAVPTNIRAESNEIIQAEIRTYGAVTHPIIQRLGSPAGAAVSWLPPGFVPYPSVIENTYPAASVGIIAIDHIVGNVELGQMERWVRFYQDVLGFTEMLHFSDEQISTEYSSLMSKVMSDGSGKIKFPINEPAQGKRKSQIDEYLEFNNGPGVQHVAFRVENIINTVSKLRSRGINFLQVPHTYYQELPGRIGKIKEDLAKIGDLGILADRDDDGYLLQLFSKPVQDRPTLFYELIQREGASGFGEGNFKALFEAIEREQEKRGNL